MNRRGFLRSALAVSVAAALPVLPTPLLDLDPRGVAGAVDELLGNSLLSSDMIAREALRVLHNTTTFISTVNREYDPVFAQRSSSHAFRVGKTKRFAVSS